MHSNQMIQLALLVAHKHPSHCPLSENELDETLGDYWAAAKCRTQCWQDELGHLEKNIRKGSSDDHPFYWQQAAPIISEILFGHVLTSVATAALVSTTASTDEFGPLVTGVFETERETRQRAELMLARACDRNLRQRRPIPHLLQLATACKQSAIWIDLFLAYLPDSNLVARYGIVTDRVQRNRESFIALVGSNTTSKFNRRVLMDIDTFFDRYAIENSSTGHLNAQISHTLQLTLGLRRRPMTIKRSASSVRNAASTSQVSQH
jgi:hypothetical protein